MIRVYLALDRLGNAVPTAEYLPIPETNFRSGKARNGRLQNKNAFMIKYGYPAGAIIRPGASFAPVVQVWQGRVTMPTVEELDREIYFYWQTANKSVHPSLQPVSLNVKTAFVTLYNYGVTEYPLFNIKT